MKPVLKPRREVTRRDVLLAAASVTTAIGTAAALASLHGCANAPAMTDAQAMADAQGLVTSTQAIETALATYAPNAVTPAMQTKIAGYEAAAIAAMQGLTQTTPAAVGAGQLQTITTNINAALGIIQVILPAAAVGIPALGPFVIMFDAAVALAPIIEGYVNTVATPVAGIAVKPLHPIHRKFSTPAEIAQAREILGVKVVPAK